MAIIRNVQNWSVSDRAPYQRTIDRLEEARMTRALTDSLAKYRFTPLDQVRNQVMRNFVGSKVMGERVLQTVLQSRQIEEELNRVYAKVWHQGKDVKTISVQFSSTSKEVLVEMVDDPDLPFRIMRDEVAVGLFGMFMEHSGYDITDEAFLEGMQGKPEDSLGFLNWGDGKALAQELGRGWRYFTKNEFHGLSERVKFQLRGEKRFWTETPFNASASFVIDRERSTRSLGYTGDELYYVDVGVIHTENKKRCHAARLVQER
ncbi:hypothetical protein ACFL31_04910 [Candidatus Margulisiibacteriota bacterium]